MIKNKQKDIVEYCESKIIEFQIQDILDTKIIGRVRTKLGGSHTVVTYPPLNSLISIDEEQIINSIQPVESINLYQHISFCEHLCPFCSYTTVYSPVSSEEKVTSYINALIKENEMWFNYISNYKISSLYIGGGTPTAISIRHLTLLLEELSKYNRTENFKACCETSPLSLTASDGLSKIRKLLSWGFNRISIGIQSFNSDLLKRSRGYDKEIAIKALSDLMEMSIEVNIDLIQDLPGQTIDHIFEDLEQIENFKPHQVTWYILRLEPEAAWYLKYEQGTLNIISEYESIKRRIIIQEAMRNIGYIPMHGNRFVRSIEFKDQYKDIRSGTDSVLLGMGASAYSHGWNYFFRNITSSDKKNAIEEYIKKIESGHFAIQKGLFINEEMKIASKLIKGIRTSATLPEPVRDGHSYKGEIREILSDLLNAGLILIQSNECSLTEKGTLFEEEICSLLYNGAIKFSLIRRDQYWDSIKKK